MAEFPEIPGYKIISKLGEGGMSTVYLGIQKKLERKVAIKILEPSLFKDEVTRLRFEREAKTAARLSNFNMIQVFDTGSVGDYFYIVMEYLQESLRDRMNLDPQGIVKPEKAVPIIESLMGALDYMHFRGIHHRDIKPENIMFRQDDTPVLVDFGIARAFDKTDGLDLTTENIVPGSPNYMSPEQCKAQKMDWRSDIYSLGVVLYEILTGKKPFDDETSIAVVLNHIQSPIPGLPRELSRYQPLIDKMLAKDKEKRLQGGTAFKELVDKILIPSFVQPGEIPLDSTREEPTSQTKLYFNKYVNVMKEKLDSSRKTIEEKLPVFKKKLLEKLISFVTNTTKRLDPIMNKPHMKKLVLGVLPGIVLLALLIVLLSQGNNFKKTNVMPPGENTVHEMVKLLKRPAEGLQLFIEQTPSFLEKIANRQFQVKLELAHQHFALGDYEKAMALVKELKRTKNTNAIKDLEIKIKNAEYRTYLDEAIALFKKKKYIKAKEKIFKAKEIYGTTDEVKSLEDSINNYLKKKN
jgi:serine/threonine protein kinase